MHESHRIGLSAEMLFAAALTDADFIVSFPMVKCGYDLVADTGTKLQRIQVRKARFVEAAIKRQGKGDRAGFQVALTSNSGSKKHARLDARRFDYLGIVCSPTQFYLIPAKRMCVPGSDEVTVRMFRIKPPEMLHNSRTDSLEAAERWEPYRNNFSQMRDECKG